MKKSVITLGFVFCALFVLGQNFKGSLFFGPSFSHVRGDYMTGYNKPGYHMGFRVAFPFSEKLDVSMAMSYSQKGSRRTYNADGFGSGSWHLLRTGYIEIPITLHTWILNGKVELQGGLAVGRLMHSYWSDIIGSGDLEQDFIRSFEYPFQLGAAYAWKENTYVYFRHSTSIFSVAKGDFSTFLHDYNRGLIHLAAMIGIERKF